MPDRHENEGRRPRVASTPAGRRSCTPRSSGYGEDFAESFMVWVLDPALLASRSPRREAFIDQELPALFLSMRTRHTEFQGGLRALVELLSGRRVGTGAADQEGQ